MWQVTFRCPDSPWRTVHSSSRFCSVFPYRVFEHVFQGRSRTSAWNVSSHLCQVECWRLTSGLTPVWRSTSAASATWCLRPTAAWNDTWPLIVRYSFCAHYSLCGCCCPVVTNAVMLLYPPPLQLHLAISELWFGQEWEGILLELLCSSSIV